MPRQRIDRHVLFVGDVERGLQVGAEEGDVAFDAADAGLLEVAAALGEEVDGMVLGGGACCEVGFW